MPLVYALLGRYYSFTAEDIGKLTPRQVRMYMEQMMVVERMMNGEEEPAPPKTNQQIIEEAQKFGLKPPVKR